MTTDQPPELEDLRQHSRRVAGQVRRLRAELVELLRRIDSHVSKSERATKGDRTPKADRSTRGDRSPTSDGATRHDADPETIP